MKFNIMRNLLNLWIIVIAVSVNMDVSAQQILLDKPVKAGELTLFPDLNDKNAYFYVADKPVLAKHGNESPKFSFLRYVENIRSRAGEEDIREGGGGGIVHAVVSIGVSTEQLQDARQALRQINPTGVITGPVIFKGGTVSLISSFTNESKELTEQVLGFGPAPLLDGEQAAFSVQLTKKGAKILWESFQTTTPDMSVSFEMEVSGYLSPKRALIEADFEKIYENKIFEAAATTPVLAAEIKTAFEDLVKTGAIKVTQIGTDENMEKLLEAAYAKLTKMMLDPAGGTGTPSLEQMTSIGAKGKSMLDRATAMLGKARSEAKAENKQIRFNNKKEEAEYKRMQLIANAFLKEEGLTRAENKKSDKPKPQSEVKVPGLAVAISFQLKRIRHQGKFTIDLNKYTAENLTLRFDENFGTIDCNTCFHQVNLDDPLYKQREVNAFLDGMNADDFGKYINYVNVVLKKTHQSGEVTMDEVKINRTKFNADANAFKMLYGWKGDEHRKEWMDYEYRTTWSFFGGHVTESNWQKTNIGTIPLAPPFLRQIIDIEADPEMISASNVRQVEVKIYYMLGQKEYVKKVRLNPSKEEFSKQIEIILPKGESSYDYEIFWHVRGEAPKHSGRKSYQGTIIYVDSVS